MSNSLNILFITTQYRAGERIYPIIPHLAKDYNLDLLKIYHMHPKTGKWGGDIDLRKVFDKQYNKHFQSIFSSPPNLDKYNLIIADDNRIQSGLQPIYLNRRCLMLANSHGCSDHNYETINYQQCYDGCFVFGKKEVTEDFHIPGGIPSNDELVKYKNVKKEHILIITNFLGNQPSFTDHKGFKFEVFNERFFNEVNLLDLQKTYKKPIVIKLKSREDQDYKENIEYIKNLLPVGLTFKILVDVEDDNLLIAQSKIVISAPSTLALKPIQLQIPTVLIKGYGQTSIFKDYKGLVNLDYNQIKKSISSPPSLKFILDTIEGGITFNSTEHYINYIKQCLNEK